jgi:hypothetical protein
MNVDDYARMAVMGVVFFLTVGFDCIKRFIPHYIDKNAHSLVVSTNG